MASVGVCDHLIFSTGVLNINKSIDTAELFLCVYRLKWIGAIKLIFYRFIRKSP